jgi:type IV pilus assembly protein PilV
MKLARLNGEGLVEVLITLLIVVVGVLGIVRFQNYLAYNNSLAQQQEDATIIALQELEMLRDYQVLDTTSGYTAYQDIVSGAATIVGVTATFTATWTVTTTATPSYKKIDLTVSWVDRNNVTQSIRMITQVAGVDPSTSAAAMY